MSLSEGEFIDDIVGCARCHGEGHQGLVFKPLTYPIEMGTVKMDSGISVETQISATHWAACPTNGEPILMTYVSKPIVCAR